MINTISFINFNTSAYMYVGDSYYNNVGAHMSFAGDVDGDGLDDVLIGAPGWADGQYNKGKVSISF